MAQTRDSQQPAGYRVDDEKIEALIDQLIKEVAPYPHLELLREVFVTGVKLAQDDCSRGDLRVLRAAIKEMRYAFKVFSRYRGTPKLSLFGSARTLPLDPAYPTALEFSRKMAEAGFMVITGAGPGIMEAGHAGAGRAKSFGLNILLPFEPSANETILGDEKLINFFYFFPRKLFFVKESDAVVLMPGGFGTLDEGFEVLTLVQTGKGKPMPIVMLDAPGGSYWKDWLEFARKQLFGGGYISPEDEALFFITDDIDSASREIHDFYRRYHSSRYVDHKRKLVLRLKQSLPEGAVEQLNQDFEDILREGAIESSAALPEEAGEEELAGLPRLVLSFDRYHFGRLRQLIDAVNQF